MEATSSGQDSGIKSRMEDFCSRTTAHGLAHINGNKSTHGRGFWLMVVLALFVALVYNVGVTLYGAVNVQDIKTETTWKQNRGGIMLPQTVFCDLSVFRQSRLDARNVSDQLAGYLASSIGGYTFTNNAFIADTPLQAELFRQYRALLQPNETYLELLDALSPSCPDLFEFCVLENDEFIPAEECCRRYIRRVRTIRGYCFKVREFPQRTDGKEYGTQYSLSLPRSEFPYLDRTIITGCMGTRLGVEVLLDEPSRLPHQRVYTHSLAMSAPSAAELRLTMDRIDRGDLQKTVAPPLHRCMSYQAGNDSAVPEDFYNCPTLRLAEAVVAECGCKWMSLPETAGSETAPVCEPNQVVGCVVHVERRLKLNPPPQCLLPCLEHIYRPTLVITKHSPRLEGPTEEVNGRAQSTKQYLRVYFPSLQYQNIRQWCQTGNELLAEFGGHMGLFLGVSIVTLCEVFSALLDFLVSLCPRRYRSTVNSTRKDGRKLQVQTQFLPYAGEKSVPGDHTHVARILMK